MGDIRTYFQIIKLSFVYFGWHSDSTTIPAHGDVSVSGMNVFGQSFHSLRIIIPTHKTDTSDIMTELTHEIIDDCSAELGTDVSPEVFAMTTRTVTGAI
jgi:hypothetical protein